MYIRNMNYKYRVTLAGIKGFFRVYLVNGGNSLYRFHKQLQSDLEFPADQQILFKALDAEGNVVARYALIDLGFGTVDTVHFKDTIKAGVASFVYFYDVSAKKSVIVTLEEEAPEEQTANPKLLESKGPAPIEFEHGYVAFEDLPEERRHTGERPKFNLGDDDLDDEDEDDDDEEEDEDDEKPEEIYDENEEM